MNDLDSTVYVIDDDPPVLKAISRLLRSAGFHVTGFSSPRRFLEQFNRNSPGCVVSDLAMPGLNGLELQKEMAATGGTLPIIFLTGRGDVPSSVIAMKHGAADFLTKPVDRTALLQAVHAAMAKDRATRLARQEVDDIRRRLSSLTPREYEVFEHVIQGRLNKQTAYDLGAAEKTIKVHRARVMDKMQAESVADLVRLSIRAGISPDAAESAGVALHETKVQ